MTHEFRKRKNFKFRRLLPLAGVFAAALALVFAGGRTPPSVASAEPLPRHPELMRPLLAWQGEVLPAPAADPAGWDNSVEVTVLLEGRTTTLTLEDYLWGVVAAEMPANFHQQALNAQACAARSYTVYKLLHPTAAHEEDLCDNTGCCQAWMSREERLERWGGDGQALAEKITQAVADTDGMAVCWEGEVIQAVFHAASAAATRSAGSVWGSEVAYLQSVPSPEGEEVPNYYSVVTLSGAEFREKLPECDLSGDASEWIGPMEYDENGLSASVTIGGKHFSTGELRRRFSLRSACFTLEAGEDAVTFYVTGYGHGVGLSQYGANALAGEGKVWQEILRWYYSGADVENLADKSLDLG